MRGDRILLVDDSPTELARTRHILEAAGYRVSTATDGDDALVQMVRETPDLIVLDVVMPKRNGFQVCRKIKAGPRTRNAKVIMLSTKTAETDLDWGLRQGADLYMTKPFRADELVQNVKRLLAAEPDDDIHGLPHGGSADE